MKALVFTKYGPPDVLELREVAKPAPAEDEVLVRVRAASLNDWDFAALQGADLINRMIFGLRRPKKQILGSDISGVVEAVGSRVLRFQRGDEVFGDLSGAWGGFAEYVRAHESKLALKPSGMTFEQAAAIPQAAMLAVQALCDKGALRAGQRLLINGAGGGVGTFAIQIARELGASVTAVDSAEKLEMLREMGAEEVIDYRAEDFTKRKERYDLILDVKTARSVGDCTRALKPGGMYVTVGGTLVRLLQALALIPWIALTGKKIALVNLKTNKDLEYMKELFAAGKVIPVIDGPYRLEEAREVFRRFGEGRHKGKVVFTFDR